MRALRDCFAADTCRRVAATAAVCALLVAVSCGKKGPPLAPLVTLPEAVGGFAARRLAREVVLQFTVPAANADGTRPADVLRVEVYAYPETLRAPADYVAQGTLVGVVVVKPPAVEGQEPARTGAGAPPGVDQGAPASVREMLRPDPILDAAPHELGPPIRVNRYYVAVGVNQRGRRGAFSRVLGVPVTGAPASPGGLMAAFSEDGVALSWLAAEGSRTYNVYEEPEAGGSAAGSSAAPTALPSTPLNTSPLETTAFKHEQIDVGRARCYVVRSLATVDGLRIESEPSGSVCLTPIDTFPPSAPRALAAIASGNAISLIWEANTEQDLAGYLVLRGEAPGEKLAPLTTTPIRETTYRDTQVRPGVTYVYVVAAVDNATPANVSPYSNQATEVVR